MSAATRSFMFMVCLQMSAAAPLGASKRLGSSGKERCHDFLAAAPFRGVDPSLERLSMLAKAVHASETRSRAWIWAPALF